MVLREFSVDISPALTGAGIVGVALGFGAQTLVRDLIGGFFLILENQIRVGDSVSVNGIGGLVEAIGLRTTLLRDEEGAVHVIPNGAITTLANRSKDFSYYVISLPVAYGENIEAVRSAPPGDCRGMQAGGPLQAVHPCAARDRRGGFVRRERRAAQDANQDGAAEAVGSRPRTPAPHHGSPWPNAASTCSQPSGRWRYRRRQPRQ